MDTTPAPSSSAVEDFSQDAHASKIAPDDPRLRIPAPRGRTLKKGAAMAVATMLAGVVALALAFAVQPATKRAGQKDQPTPTASYRPPIPDAIAGAPDNTSPLGALPVRPGPRRVLTRAEQAAAAGDGVGLPDTTPSPGLPGAGAQAQKDAEIFWRARSAGVFADVGDGPDRDPPRTGAEQPRGAYPAGAAGVAGGGGTTAAHDPNYQDRKNDFLTASKPVDPYLEQPVLKPRSPYQVMAGTIVPTVLITGINSDLPGEVIAQVRENVYDSVSGNYLLIPQGSRLLATYDSLVAWGQERVLVCWNRLIRPDGSSIALGCMPGVDLAGYAGIADDVDNHWWKIISGAALSSLLAVGAQTTTGNVQGYNPSLPQQWTAGAAGDIASAGQQITRRNLNIQPTITVRPGFSVNVVVTKDVVLPPYSG